MLNLQVKDALQVSGYAYLMETLGTRIKQLREAKNYTQSELGKLLGVTKSAVSQWENDQSANIKLVEFLHLCRILGTDPYYLVFGADRERAVLTPRRVR
jgi:transcriptional regulator with XRE-family HTH domain